MKPFRHLPLLLVVSIAPIHAAPESIQLAPEDLSRLGIAFATVKSGATGVGPRFPATVISSPDSVSTVTAPYSGVVEKWLVAPGDTVRAGQPLVVIRSQEALRLQQDWMAAVAGSEAAGVELEKAERLLQEGIVSNQRVMLARRAREQAVFAQRAAEEALRRIGFTAERLGSMRSDAEGLGVYRLVAQADGTVTRRMGGTGDFVADNTALLNLRAAGPNWVSLHVPARVVAGLQTGQILRLTPGGEELVLRHKDHGLDDRSQTAGLLAEFKSESPHLPGQIVAVELPPPPSGLLVPNSAVVHSGNETTVFVRTAAGIEARAVALEPMGADYVASGGLKAGDEIVVRGTAVLKGIKAGFGDLE